MVRKTTNFLFYWSKSSWMHSPTSIFHLCPNCTHTMSTIKVMNMRMVQQVLKLEIAMAKYYTTSTLHRAKHSTGFSTMTNIHTNFQSSSNGKTQKKRKHEDVYQNHEDDTRTSIKLLQRYILTVFFFSTNGEYNTNLGRQFTPSSNITAYGSLRFLSERDVCRWNAKMSVKTRMGAHTRKRRSARERYVEDGVHSNDNGHKLRARTWTRRTYTKKTYGIICDGGGKVIEMNLQGLGISGGSIPAEIGLLYNLKKLDLRGNYLTGTVPNSIGGINAYSADDGREEEDFVLNGSLEYLDLSGNMLVGPVPDALGSLTHLESLFLHSNRIHGGKIPSSLCTRFHGGDGDDDDRDSTNCELNFSGRDLWADCGRKFDAVFCECCTYCCDSSSADCEPNDGTIRGNASAFTGGLDESENKFDDDAHHL